MNATLSTYRPDTPPVGGAVIANASAQNSLTAAQTAKSATAPTTSGSGFGFSDVLAILNPLQHIPVIDTLYREWTGDTISPAARIAGDTLYGGVIGLAASVADTLVEGTTGKDIGSHIYDTLFGSDTPTPAASAPAASTPATAAAATPADPTSFMATMQHGNVSHKRVVPLATSVPVANAHPGQQASSNSALSQAEANAALSSAAQQATNTYGALGSPLPPSTPSALPSQPPTPNTASSIAPASPTQNPLAATPPDGISNLMLQALDKYNAMAKQNGVNGGTVSLTN